MHLYQSLKKLCKSGIKLSLYQHNELNVPKPLLYLFSVLSVLQPLSYTIQPLYAKSENSSYFKLLAYVARPHLILDLEETTLALLALQITSGSIFLFQTWNSYTILAVRTQSWWAAYLKISTFLAQLLDFWLFNVLVEIFYQKNISPVSIIASLITLIFLLYRIIITRTRISINCENFNTLNTSFLAYTVATLNIIQITVFILEKDFPSAQIWQSILGTFRCLFELLNTVIYRPIIKKQVELVLLSVTLCTLIYNFLRLVQFNSGQEVEIVELTTVLMLPFTLRLFSKLQFINLIQNTKKLNNLYQVAFLCNYVKSAFEHSHDRILVEALINDHKRSLSIAPARQTGFTNQDIKQFCQSLLRQADAQPSRPFARQRTSISEQDVLVYIALLLFLEDYYESFQRVIQLKGKRRHFLSQVRFEVYGKKSYEMLLGEINNKSSQKGENGFDHAVNAFLKGERKNEMIAKKVVEIFQKKLAFLQRFNFESSTQMYHTSMELVRHIEKLLAQIHKQYKLYPSQKLQCVLVMLSAELTNDYFSASKLQKQAALEDEKLLSMNNEIKIDFSNNRWAYLMINLEDMRVMRSSSNALSFFSAESLVPYKMIPPCIRQYHDEFIDNFLRTGKSRYFRNFAENLYFLNGYLKYCNFFIEVFNEDEHLNAIAFFQTEDDPPIYMVVDQTLTLVALSAEFQEIFGVEQHLQLLYGIPVEYIIPKFGSICFDTQSQQICLKFLTKERLADYLGLAQHYKNRVVPTDVAEGCWLDQNNFENYIGQCQISHQPDKYFIVRFTYFRQINGKSLPSHSKTYSVTNHQSSNFDEDIDIEIPYENKSEFKPGDFIPPTLKPDLLLSHRESYNYQLEGLLNETDNRQLQDAQRSLSKNLEISANLPNNQLYFIRDQAELPESSESKKVDQEEIQSHVSSLSGTKRAIFYKKYVVVEKMLNAKDRTTTHKQFVFYMILFSILVFVRSLLSLTIVHDSFQRYLSDIDLLQIKNYLFQPVESFIVTRYTIINYNAQFSAKLINQTQLNSLLKFPNANLNLGFDDVQVNLGQILNRLTLQDFLGQYYDIYIYISTDVGDYYNITMRQTLSILINYQYTFKAAYIYDGRTVSDSPYIFFSYRNLLTIYNAFDKLNEEQYQETLARTDLDKSKELTLLIPFLVLSLFVLLVAFVVYLKIQDKIASILGLLAYTEQFTIDRDKERFKFLIDQMQKSSDFMFRYQFQFTKREIQLKNSQKILLQEQAGKRLTYQKRRIPFATGLLFVLLNYAVFVGYIGFQYSYNMGYFNQFKPTAYFYKMMADLGTNIPTIYAMREVMYYRWRYPFYDSDDMQQILGQINTCLDQMQKVTQYLQRLDKSILLLSSEFLDTILILQESNLCTKLREDLMAISTNICNITLGQSLQKGLTGALVYIYTSIRNEMQIDYFFNKSVPSYQELEGGFILGELIKDLNKNMKLDFIQTTGEVMDTIQIISVGVMASVFFGLGLLFLGLYPKLIRQYHMAKRFIYLVPQQTLFLDDTFERLARSVLMDQGIILQ